VVLQCVKCVRRVQLYVTVDSQNHSVARVPVRQYVGGAAVREVCACTVVRYGRLTEPQRRGDRPALVHQLQLRGVGL